MNNKNIFLKELVTRNLSLLASIWILERTPYIFKNNHLAYLGWKNEMAESLKIDSSAIFVTGSSAIGFSLNPNKNYRDNEDSSDIDVAIISDYYFDLSWHYLRNIGALRYSLSPKQKISLEDHVNRLIYWGIIATDRILSLFPYGNEWFKILEKLSKEAPAVGKNINIRVFKDSESLKAYQINSLNGLKNKLLKSKEGL